MRRSTVHKNHTHTLYIYLYLFFPNHFFDVDACPFHTLESTKEMEMKLSIYIYI